MKSLGVIALFAAQVLNPRTEPAQDEVVIRSTTRLVQVYVAAQDREGNPVTNLRKEEFQILDDGKERPLAFFAAEESASTSASALAAGDEKKEQPGTEDGYSAILLDWINGNFADRLRADEAVRAVLKTFQPRQKVAIFALGTEPPNSPHPLRLIRNFTDASADIGDAIEDPLVLPHPEMDEAFGRFDARYGGPGSSASIEEQLFDWNNRILDTLKALSELADRMRPLRGRKSLVWLTNGFSIVVNGSIVRGARNVETSYRDSVERVLERFNRAEVAVHTVDSKGLATIGRSYGATLRDFAEQTGGMVFSARNDLEQGVRVALEHLHSGYALGFLASENTPAGIHAIQVRTTRPHVTLRFRRAYQFGS